MSTDFQGFLPRAQGVAILELARRGPGGNFDQEIMAQLFVLGLIEVRNEDRRVGLTESGRQACKELSGC